MKLFLVLLPFCAVLGLSVYLSREDDRLCRDSMEPISTFHANRCAPGATMTTEKSGDVTYTVCRCGNADAGISSR